MSLIFYFREQGADAVPFARQGTHTHTQRKASKLFDLRQAGTEAALRSKGLQLEGSWWAELAFDFPRLVLVPHPIPLATADLVLALGMFPLYMWS